MCVLSSVRLLATLQTVACQAPLPMGLSRQEYWSGLPFPFPEDLPNPGIETTTLESPGLAGKFLATGKPLLWPILEQLTFAFFLTKEFQKLGLKVRIEAGHRETLLCVHCPE